ncbi:MAG: response regulator transcription factor [Lachnospiraceae bacterium]|nr:response regulator transcription factor [Lachnospiraceae bacterium]
MRIAICEDEHIYLELIKTKVVEYFKKRQVSINTDSYTDASLLPAKIDEGKHYDLILMDLQMKHSDGMEIMKGLRARSVGTPVIFVTGLEERAYEGYGVDALDYVVKKDMDTRLPEALNRFVEKSKAGILAIPGRDGETNMVKTDEILWAESDGRGSKFIVKEARETINIESRLAIGKVTEMLPQPDFVEIYKSIYVNVSEIKRVGNDTVKMSDGRELPLSRRKRNDVLKAVLDKVRK